MLSTKGMGSLISIKRPSYLFLWRSSRTAAHPGVFILFSHVGHLGFLDSGNVDNVAVEESQQFSDSAADSVRVPCHQL